MATYDAIIVPSGETKRARSNEALRQFREHTVGGIYITGAHGGLDRVEKDQPTQSEVMKRYLLEKGVPENRVAIDEQSCDTFGNFAYLADCPTHAPKLELLEKILLVTEDHHMKRALDCLRLFVKDEKITSVRAANDRTPGLVERAVNTAYHRGLLRQIEGNSAEEAVFYLEQNHPFYQNGWFDVPVVQRKGIIVTCIAEWNAFKGTLYGTRLCDMATIQ